MKSYSLANVKSRIKAIIDAKGADHVYKKRYTSAGAMGCTYAYDGQPDCIVGHLLVELGVPVEHLDYTSVERRDFSDHTISGAEYEIAREYGIEFTSDALDFLTGVQAMQDAGESWGASFDYYATRDAFRGIL